METPSHRPLLAPPQRLRCPRWLRASAWMGALLASSLMACNCPALNIFSTKRPGAAHPGAPNVQVQGVEPAYRDAWQEVEQAIARDPSSPEIQVKADALLALSPPLELQVGALTAKAQQSYRVGEDLAAIASADDARARMMREPQVGISKDLQRDLDRVTVMSLARGGDPKRALDLLDALEGSQSFTQAETAGLEAVALERSAKIPAAALAFATWRSLLADDVADAAYAESRFAALSSQLEPNIIAKLHSQARAPLAKACLSVRMGQTPPKGAPAWVLRCRDLPGKVGVLLPRSGRYAVFADTHFAAATAAIRVLADERAVSVIWRDSTSTPEGAKKAALELTHDGAQVIVGPIARAQISGVVQALGDKVRVVVPGEPADGADGVTASLKQRLRALLNYARQEKRSKVVVMMPDNSYGTRVEAALSSLRANSVVSRIRYPANTTSFRPLLAPADKLLRSGAALLIADSFPRAELVIRQLRRDAMQSDKGRSRELPLILLTAEGWSPEKIEGTHAVFDGAVMAPKAAQDADSRAFAHEYQRQQGREPDAQALLVWEAFEQVWKSKGQGQAPRVRLFKVDNDQLQAL